MVTGKTRARRGRRLVTDRILSVSYKRLTYLLTNSEPNFLSVYGSSTLNSIVKKQWIIPYIRLT